MAIEYVDSTQLDSDLTSVANAIRAKGGTSGQLQFPQGFVDAVEAIETGGGGAVYTEISAVTIKKGALSRCRRPCVCEHRGRKRVGAGRVRLGGS